MTARTQVFVVTAAAVFMSFLDATIVNIAFPDIRASFAGHSLGELSWVLSAYNVVFAALLIPLGRLGDVRGRRRLFLGGLVGFTLASALCAIAPTLTTLVVARVVQASAAAALVPSSLGLLLPEFSPQRRASATALWGATGAVAAAAGPTLGGLLVEHAGWRWVFVVNVPIGIAALLAGTRVLRERRGEDDARLPSPISIALLVLGTGALTLGITKGPATEWGWLDARTLAALAVGAGGLVAFVVHGIARPRGAVVDLALFGVRSFAAANAGLFWFAMAFYGLLLANVTFLTSVWHYGILTTGLAVSPSPLLAALSSPLVGRLADRFGQRVIAAPSVATFGAGCALYATLVDAHRDYVGSYLPAAMLTGIGIGATFAAFGSAAVAELPPTRFATGGAVSQTSRQIGAALGVAAFVAILGTPAPGAVLAAFERCWWCMAGAAAVAALAGLALPRRRVALTAPTDRAPA